MPNYLKDLRNFFKFTRQHQLVAEAIDYYDEKREGSFVFVDIGASDGKLTSLILNNLQKKHEKTTTLGCEPNDRSYEVLQERFKNCGNVKFEKKDVLSWLEAHRSKPIIEADLALNSHTYYHFSKAIGYALLYDIDGILKDGGKHIIIVDSLKSDLSPLETELSKRIRANRRFDNYGLTSPSMVPALVERFSKKKGKEIETLGIYRPIKIPIEENSLDDFVGVLSFMYRYSKEDIVKKAKGPVTDFMQDFMQDGHYVFSTTMEMYIIRK